MHRFFVSLLIVSLFSLVVPALPQQAPAPVPQSAAGQAGPKPAAVIEDVPYGRAKGSILRLDIYEPANPGAIARPAVLLIHGGGWTSFDKRTMRRMAQFLANSGFVAFSVDYRLFHDAQNRWPAQLDDVQRAVRWIRANAAKYYVDPDHIGAFGHSAGAQLAALLGMEETRDNSDPALANHSSRVQAVVDVSGPTDFTAEHPAEGDAFLNSFLGSDYSTHPEVWREASPAFHISKTNAPFLILHGTQDQNVPISQAQELYEKLQSASVPVSLIKVNDVHTFQKLEVRRQLAMESLAFFNRYLTKTP